MDYSAEAKKVKDNKQSADNYIPYLLLSLCSLPYQAFPAVQSRPISEKSFMILTQEITRH